MTKAGKGACRHKPFGWPIYEERTMSEQENSLNVVVDKKTMDMLMSNFVPSSKYFDACFANMEQKINFINTNMQNKIGTID
ncbi:MAG: hypothetical protein H7839_17010 [Magnetococcus sp. YQC-5]